MNNLSSKMMSGYVSSEIDFRDILFTLISHMWFILGVVFVVTSLGILKASLLTPQYTSNVLIQIENKQEGNMRNLTSMFPGAEKSINVDTNIGLIQSRYILDSVVDELGLDIDIFPDDASKPNNEILKFSKAHLPNQYIDQKINLVFDGKNHFSLYSIDGKKLLSGATRNLVTNSDHTITMQVDPVSSSGTSKFTLIKHANDQAEKASLASRLKIDEIGNKNSRTGILKLSMTDTNPTQLVNILNTIAKVAQAKSTEKQLIEAKKTIDFLSHQIPVVKNELENAEDKLNRYRAKSGKLDMTIQTQYFLSHLGEIDKKIEELRLKKLDMLQLYTEDHPFFIALNQQIKNLRSERNKLTSDLKKLPMSDQVAISLMRDVKVKNDLYLILLTKIQELKILEAGTISDIRILSFATVPTLLPSKRIFIVAVSFIGALISSCAIVLLRKFFIRCIDNAQEFEKEFNMLNLATIPYSKSQALNMLSLKNKSRKNVSLLANSKPQDHAIEALRSLRTGLQIIACQKKNNIISIIGASPGIGKSFIAANFAYLMAEIGKRVLLIDCDIRRGHLNDYFETPRVPGLSNILMNDAPLDIEASLKKTYRENLMFLPSGTYPQNPSELLMGSRFKELIKACSEKFDYVIIDTAPILAVTDGALVGSACEINFLVVGANMHQKEEMELTIKRLSNAGVTLQGFIFNHLRFEPKGYNGGYRGYGKYNYYYQYDTAKN